MVPQKQFTPASNDLHAMIAAAEAKFDKARERELSDIRRQKSGKPEYVRRGQLRELVEG